MSSDLGIPSWPAAGRPSPSPTYPPGADDPVPSLRSSFVRLQEDLRRAEASLTRLLDERLPEQVGEQGQRIEFWEGREAQARGLYALEYGARTSLLVFQSGANTVAPVPTTLSEDEASAEAEQVSGQDTGRTAGPTPLAPRPDANADADGSPEAEEEWVPLHTGNPHATYRVVVDSAFLTEPAALRALDERLAAGHQVRVVDHPLRKMVVADGETGVMQVEPGRSMVLRAPMVLLATELFESVWRRSRPYLPEEGDLDPMDRRILQLMLSGLTDAAAAHQLGTSPRTLQRRLRSLMDAAGVSSRVQLGWYAMRNNWV